MRPSEAELDERNRFMTTVAERPDAEALTALATPTEEEVRQVDAW
jgi:hypothetical protein